MIEIESALSAACSTHSSGLTCARGPTTRRPRRATVLPSNMAVRVLWSEALRQPLLSAAQRSLGEPANLLVAPELGPRTAHRPANERHARLVTETGRSSCAASSARRAPARCRSSRSGFMRCSCPDTGCGRSSRSAGSQGRRPPRGGRLPVCRWSSLGRPRPANRRPSAACGSRRGRAEALPGSGKGCLGCPSSPPVGPEHPVPRPAGSSWRPAPAPKYPPAGPGAFAVAPRMARCSWSQPVPPAPRCCGAGCAAGPGPS